MKKNLFSLVVLALVCIYSSCKKDADETPQNELPAFVLLAENYFGPEGGTLEAGGLFQLSIPTGAFTESVNIQLYSSMEENPYEENGASPVYYLKGIPETVLKELIVAVKHDELGTGEPFVVMGHYAVTSGAGDTIFAPLLHQATDSSGFLVASISAGIDKSSAKNDKSGELKYGVPFYCIKGMQSAYSEHFRVRFPRDVAHLKGIDSLLKGLEGAFELLHKWGFEYTKRDSWPLNVNIRRFKDTGAYGYTCWNFLRTPNSGVIEVNTAYLHETETMRVTGAHEFFHIVQAFYTTDKKYLWLGEASSVWLESFFADNPATYVPSVFFENFFQSYYGLDWGASMSKKDEHGYGCASVIKYLMEKNNALNDPKAIFNIWNATASGDHPITLLLNHPVNLPNWWDNYVFSFYTDQIYPTMTKQFGEFYFKDHPNYLYTVSTAADNQKEFIHQAVDLSGRVFKIDIKRNDLTEDSRGSIKLAGSSSTLYVFRIHGFSAELLTTLGDGEEYEITNLKELHDNGYDLILLYSNHAIDPGNGYGGFRNISIFFKIWESEHIYSLVSAETNGAPFDVEGVAGQDYTLKCLDNDHEFGAGYRFIWNFGDGSGEVVQEGINTISHQWDSGDVYTVQVEIRKISDNSLVGVASNIAVIENLMNYLPLLHSIKHITVELPADGHHFYNDGSVCSENFYASSEPLDNSGGKINWNGTNFSVSGFYNNNWNHVSLSGHVSADGDSLLYVKAIWTFNGGTGFTRDSLYMELINLPLSYNSTTPPVAKYNISQGNDCQSHVQSLYFKKMISWQQWLYYHHSDWAYVSIFAGFNGARK